MDAAQTDGGGASAGAGAAVAPAGAAPVAAARPVLLDLPDAALLSVMARLRDPLPLGSACRHLSALLRERALHAEWLAHHGAAAAPRRPAAARALTFPPLRGAPAREVAAVALALVEAGGGAPEAVAAARAAARGGRGPLDMLRLLCPHSDVLLLPYIAAGGHDALLAEAMAQLWPPPNGTGSGGAGGGGFSAGGRPSGGGRDGSSGGSGGSGAAADGRFVPASPAHLQLGEVDLPRLALHAALRARSWRAASALLRAERAAQAAAAREALAGELAGLSLGPGPGPGPGAAQAEAAAAAAAAEAAARRPSSFAGLDEAAARAGCGAQLLWELRAAAEEWREPNRYFLLAAAAGSGRPETLAAAAATAEAPSMVRCQLPAALCEAGRRGHVACVEALLRNEHMSPRPLEIAAHDAAERGWPPAALRPVLAAVVARHREDAARMLAAPMEAAMARGRRGVAAAIWEALIQGRPEPERLNGLIVRLAAAGDYDRALWVADASPPVMVRVGTAPAAAAAERGHERVARLMTERAGRPLPGGRALAARGRLAAAVRAGDVRLAARLLSEITLGPGDLRRELLCAAAEAGDEAMLALLYEQAGPFIGEEFELVSALIRSGHWRLVPRLHALAAAGPAPRARAGAGGAFDGAASARARLLRACCKVAGSWAQPHLGLVLWTLRATTNPRALDLIMADFADAWSSSLTTSYLESLVAPDAGVAISFSNVVKIWTELFGRLADGGGGDDDGGGGGGELWHCSCGGERGAGGCHHGGGPAGAGPSGRPPAATGQGRGGALPCGATVFTRRQLRLVVQTGDPDLLHQALRLLDRWEASMEVR
ncbi:hypothetical protein Rsub_08115 [Raphidocelis subcapitata]|uniref:Uncharacterized protein n=1 Tax=Raphidocelis subcapitata TaxID=307507 RepID=A0A2V0P7G9_9CHLO|nr:hypothetical protein Rsub_08115 [Raphidocelis subcapitata]|eukprot:GBF94872.1 hypothetical protein Rsub_08115 [Raphidocelis subcapitata]